MPKRRRTSKRRPETVTRSILKAQAPLPLAASVCGAPPPEAAVSLDAPAAEFPCDAVPAFARTPAHPDHARPSGLLGILMGGGEIRYAQPVPKAPLTRRSGKRDAFGARQAAGYVNSPQLWTC